MRYYRNLRSSGHAAGKSFSFDRPCVTIMASGMGGDWVHQWEVVDDGNEEPPMEPTPGKPPYRVPLMAEINAMPWNGHTAISTFSGGGGSTTGYKMAGYKLLWANEFIPAARDSYAANHPTSILDPRDIRTIAPEEILAACGLKQGELDLFDGSPPCSAFSTAGKRDKDWGKSKDYSDGAKQVIEDLFFEYTRLLKGLQPKTFVAENVSGLVKGVAKGYFVDILKAMKGCGYKVAARVLDASWLGVPQARQRVIFVGVREDLGFEPVHPTPLPYQYTMRDAIPWIRAAIKDTKGNNTVIRKEPDDPAMTIVDQPHHYIIEADSWMTGKSTGDEWERIAVGGQSEKYFQLVKPHPDAPTPTVTASGGNAGLASVAHPYENRKFSIGELKRICSFPDDYVLTGTYAQQWERLGRSVPPVMMYHIAKAIQENILDPLKAKAAA